MNVSRKVNDSVIDMLKNFSKTSSPRYFLDKYEYYYVKPNGGEEDLKKTSLLGEGGFGAVYRVREIKARDPYAVKVVKMNYEENYSSGHATTISEMDQNRIFMFVKYCQEACLLSDFCHSNIVKVHETWIQMDEEGSENDGAAERFESEALANIQVILNFLRESGESGSTASAISGNVAEALEKTQGLTLYMVMDLYDTDLNKHVHNLNDENKVEIIKDLVKAIDYLHSKHYCHLDLKPSNILLQTSSNQVKVAVADFGLCTRFRPEAIPREPGAGTYPFNAAPDTNVSDKLDIWAFGLIVYYIIASGPTNHELVMLLKTKNETGEVSVIDHLDPKALPEFQPIICKCLRDSYFLRISTQELSRVCIEKDIPTTVSTYDYPPRPMSDEDDSIYFSAAEGSFTDHELSSNLDNLSINSDGNRSLASSIAEGFSAGKDDDIVEMPVFLREDLLDLESSDSDGLLFSELEIESDNSDTSVRSLPSPQPLSLN